MQRRNVHGQFFLNAEAKCPWTDAQVPAKIRGLKIYWFLLAEQLEDGITYSSCAPGRYIEVPQSLTTAVVVAIYHRKFSRAYHDDL